MSTDVDRFYRTFIREAPDAIIYANAEGRIAFWNKSAERIFGFSEAEAVGKSLDIIIPEDFRTLHWDGFAKATRTGKVHYGTCNVFAVLALRKNGSQVSIEFTVLPFVDRTGKTLGIGAILRDASKRFKETDALRSEIATRRTTAV